MMAIQTSQRAVASPVLQELVDAAHPFLRITGVERVSWCRDIANPRNKRIGPWKYKAQFAVLDDSVWSRKGEVLYFATDAGGRLRLVGQSSRRLKDRWRTSPMHDVQTRRPLGQWALFHTTSWPEIERGLDAGEAPPFTVSAIFRDELQVLCERTGGPLAAALACPETRLHRLSYHVETWICGQSRAGLHLWNKDKT